MSKPGRIVGLALLAVASACGGGHDEAEREPSVATLYELDLRPALPEQGVSFLGEDKPGLSEALLRTEKLMKHKLAKGLFVRLGELHGRFGDLADWSQLFDAVRANKKPVHCHFDSADNLSFALANHCDRVSMTPSGTLDLVGLAAQVIHGRELLEMLGVQADLLQVGKYKGAAEPFTRETLSDELRQSLDGLLDDLDATFRQHLTHGDKRSAEAVTNALENGPYSAEAALQQKLIDDVSFDDEARAIAKKTSEAGALRQVFPEHESKALSLSDLLDLFQGKKEAVPDKAQRLAMVYLTGEIVDGDGDGLENSASEPFVKAMRRFADDSRVSTVVLRIESPGGSALASDRMWHAVRRAAGRKPVIVSVGDMAASGGYYVASAGTTILASPGSVLGSIGVVGGKMVISKLADRAGVNVTALPRAPHATWLSALSPFSESERARLEALLNRTYVLFLERVAHGRKRSVAQLTSAAEGRVMGGARAKAHGLIDGLGGLADAVRLARKEGKLADDAPIVRWPKADDPLAKLGHYLGVRHPDSALSAGLSALGPEVERVGRSVLLRAVAHHPAHAVAALPFELILR